jgi:hypothetical protein
MEKFEFTLAIADGRQLVDAYPEWFKRVDINSVPFFLEEEAKKSVQELHRYIITPSGIVRIDGKRDLIWGITERDVSLLYKFNTIASEERIKWEKGDIVNRDLNLIEIDDYNIGVEYIPYGGEQITRDAFKELEKAHAYDSKKTGSNIE